MAPMRKGRKTEQPLPSHREELFFALIPDSFTVPAGKKAAGKKESKKGVEGDNSRMGKAAKKGKKG